MFRDDQGGICTEFSMKTAVRSKQDFESQSVSTVPPPMKITYARRVHSTTRPDDGYTNDERVVVEWPQLNAGVPPKVLQGDFQLDSPELDTSEEAATEVQSSRQNKLSENAQSQRLETHPSKPSLCNEEDFKQAHVFIKAEANGACTPIADQPSYHKLQDSDGEPRPIPRGYLLYISKIINCTLV